MESRTGTIVLLKKHSFSGEPCIGVVRTTHLCGENEIVTQDCYHLTAADEDIIPLCQTREQERVIIENGGPELIRDILERYADQIIGVYADLYYAMKKSQISKLRNLSAKIEEPVHRV